MSAKRILIIDDDVVFCEELMDVLKDEGYSVECVQDSIKGEELICGDNCDIVLLDYKMPGLSGINILKKMRMKRIKKKVFMISGRPFIEKALEEEGLSDMIDGIVAKPVNVESLLEKIKKSP